VIGEIGALGCAPLWAISTILLKSQTDKLDALRINAIRGVLASAFLLAVVLISGKIDQLGSLSFSSIAYLWASVIIGLVLGDTLYIKGMGIIGASKALPISVIYPIFVLPFSVTIIGESLSLQTISGVFITVLGLYLITAPQRASSLTVSQTARRQYWIGVSFVLAASLCWAVGTTILRFAMIELDPILAGAIRTPFMTLVLFAVVGLRKRNPKRWKPGLGSLAILSLAGILGIGLGGVFFMLGVKHAGPAKTAILSGTAPLFGVPLSMIILHEKITLKIALGTILCVIGIWFVI
jgi:DME family drug/metabolite transporter